MLELLGILLFALLIAGSIALHELGHLVPAKKFGVKVTQYMIGFGPTLWSKVKGETQYGVKAVPLGGYIRMVGMLPPGPDGTSRQMSTGRFGAMINDARQQSVLEIEPGEESRAFYRLPVRKRVIIMLGGPFMNLALAFVLFGIVLVGIGIPEPGMQIRTVAQCTPASAQAATTPLPSGECPTGTVPSPAVVAGIEPGDTILEINGAPATNTWKAWRAPVRCALNGHQKTERGSGMKPSATTTVPFQNREHAHGSISAPVSAIRLVAMGSGMDR